MNRRSLYIIIASFVLLVLVLAAFVLWPDPKGTQVVNNQKPIDNAEASIDSAQLKTVTPVVSSNFSTLLLAGTVQSYETAKIAARAEGIISDIYVEVGDRITAGQTLATLLPHGTEGQAAAEIAEARAMRNQVRIDLDNALRLAEAARNRSKTNLLTTQQSQTANVSVAQRGLEVSRASLNSTQDALVRAKATREARLLEAANTINQAADQLIVTASNAYQMVNTLIPTNKNQPDRINTSHLATYLGALNNATRTIFVNGFNLASAEKNDISSLSLTAQRKAAEAYTAVVVQLLKDAEILLRASIATDEISQSMLDEELTDIHTMQQELLEARQMITSAINERNVMQKVEDAEVETMENELREKQKMLSEAEEMFSLSEREEEREGSLAATELTELTTEWDAEVAKARAELATMDARLAISLSASGHFVIKAPTSGIIAKRLINVGDDVMPNRSVFEIVDADTTLSRKSTGVIQFGAPEELFDLIAEQSPIEIILPGQTALPHRALVTRKAAQIDPMTRTFTLLAQLTDEMILAPNTNVRIRVVTEKNPAWQVPSRAVKRMDGLNHLWIMADDKPQQITIELLAEDGEFADVRSDELTADVRVIVDPPDTFFKKSGQSTIPAAEIPMAGHNS